MFFLFFVNQKTAYEMRISDWSSDVCSSDLAVRPLGEGRFLAVLVHVEIHNPVPGDVDDLHLVGRLQPAGIGGRNAFDHVDVAREPDRTRGVSGQRVLVRVDMGGRRLNKKKKQSHKTQAINL